VADGYDQGSIYLHNVNIELKLDLDALVGIPKTSFTAKSR